MVSSDAERIKFYSIVDNATASSSPVEQHSHDKFLLELPRDMIPAGMQPNFTTVWDFLGIVFSQYNTGTDTSGVEPFATPLDASDLRESVLECGQRAGLFSGDTTFAKVETASLPSTLDIQSVASAALNKPIFDLTPFPSLQRSASLWEPAFNLSTPDMYETHTEASRKVVELLYPSLAPSDIGMDRISGDFTATGSCPIANCGELVHMHIDSVRKHVGTKHLSDRTFCECGKWLTGGIDTISWHISGLHFCEDHIRCRSCKTLRKKGDFASHLVMCPALAQYRTPESVVLGFDTVLGIDRTPVVAGAKRKADQESATPRKKVRLL